MPVRDATEEDLPALIDMVAAEAREAEGRELDRQVVAAAVTAALRDPSLARTWLLEEGGERLGAVAAVREWSDWSNAAYWWIQFAYLVVHRDNARAIRAYRRIGFADRPYLVMAEPLARSDGGAAPELDDDRLWTAFHARGLSHAQWNHAAHLRIAWLHLERYGVDEAHLRMRAGIVRLNAAHGLVESPARGYHETLTRVWLILVAEARARARGASSAAFVAAQPLSRDVPLRFYSRERLLSLEARATFVPPDLAPLPDVR